MSKLVIAEKPSVAGSIAEVLGATKKEDGFLEGNAYEELHESNLRIHRGIKKLEKLTDSEVHYLIEKPDLIRMSIKYKGLVFSQLGK